MAKITENTKFGTLLKPTKEGIKNGVFTGPVLLVHVCDDTIRILEEYDYETKLVDRAYYETK